MKKVLIQLFLILSIIPNVDAQSFAPAGSYWHYCWIGVGPIIPAVYEHSGFDTIAGKESIFIKRTPASGFPIPPFLDSLYLHVQGDSTYMFYAGDSTYNLVFDFSLSPGDTFVFNRKNAVLTSNQFPISDTSYVKMIVIDTGTSNMNNGIPLRYYRMDMIASNVIENWDFHFFERMEIWEHFGASPVRLIDGTGPASSSIIIPYFGAQSNLFHFSIYKNELNGNYMNNLPCWLSIDEFQGALIDVYPNPFTTSININVGSESIFRGLELSDFSGRRMNIHYTQNSSQIIINAEPLSAGIYYLKILLEGKKNIMWKVIKQ